MTIIYSEGNNLMIRWYIVENVTNSPSQNPLTSNKKKILHIQMIKIATCTQMSNNSLAHFPNDGSRVFHHYVIILNRTSHFTYGLLIRAWVSHRGISVPINI